MWRTSSTQKNSKEIYTAITSLLEAVTATYLIFIIAMIASAMQVEPPLKERHEGATDQCLSTTNRPPIYRYPFRKSSLVTFCSPDSNSDPPIFSQVKTPLSPPPRKPATVLDNQFFRRLLIGLPNPFWPPTSSKSSPGLGVPTSELPAVSTILPTS